MQFSKFLGTFPEHIIKLNSELLFRASKTEFLPIIKLLLKLLLLFFFMQILSFFVYNKTNNFFIKGVECGEV